MPDWQEKCTTHLANVAMEQHIKRATYESDHVCNLCIISLLVSGIEAHWKQQSNGDGSPLEIDGPLIWQHHQKQWNHVMSLFTVPAKKFAVTTVKCLL